MQPQKRPSQHDETVVVRGSVERITFRNPENGYSVLQLRIAQQTELLTVVGSVADIRVGHELLARGEYQEHPKFGRQLKAYGIELTTPSSPEGIERYLASGVIKGIGPKTAARIVEKFGTDTLEVIHRFPEKLAKIPGIGKNKARTISAVFEEQSEIQEVMRFLVEHNISTGLASRIFKKYGAKAVEVLKQDAYLLAREMKGIGFATADSIALNVGLSLDSPQRMKAGVYHALEKASDEGHCFLLEEELVKKAALLLNVADEQLLLPHLQSLVDETFLQRRGENIYLKPLAVAEQFVADFIADRCRMFEKALIEEKSVEYSLAVAEVDLGISFSFEQKQAVYYATQYPLLAITGGPGCGKTTVIKAIVSTFQRAKQNVVLAAPTGRAAQRMAQVSSTPARTIHRLLRYDPMTGGFLHGINDPLEVDGEPVDVVIIDEASMIDIQLAKDLFSAIPKDASVILVGDKDQLPSVGPGTVFGDILAIPQVQTLSLSQLFRRAQESTINSVAHHINAGIRPEIPAPDGVTKADAYFIERKEPEEAARLIERLVSDQLPKKFNLDPREIMVLTPSNRGPLGTITLNNRLQETLNPDLTRSGAQELSVHDITLREGDRICQRVNNYNLDEIGVFNGDVGTIYKVDTEKRTITVELWDGRLIHYEGKALSQLNLGYTLTVHRSQGSEIPCVVLVLHESHFTLLERQLIYTAVTRAKKLLVIVGSKRALEIACKRISSKRRYSDLHDRAVKSLERLATLCPSEPSSPSYADFDEFTE